MEGPGGVEPPGTAVHRGLGGGPEGSGALSAVRGAAPTGLGPVPGGSDGARVQGGFGSAPGGSDVGFGPALRGSARLRGPSTGLGSEGGERVRPGSEGLRRGGFGSGGLEFGPDPTGCSARIWGLSFGPAPGVSDGGFGSLGGSARLQQPPTGLGSGGRGSARLRGVQPGSGGGPKGLGSGLKADTSVGSF